MKTYAVKAGEIRRRWLVVDAAGKTLGRLAAEIAGLLSGKYKPMFSRAPRHGRLRGRRERGEDRGHRRRS